MHKFLFIFLAILGIGTWAYSETSTRDFGRPISANSITSRGDITLNGQIVFEGENAVNNVALTRASLGIDFAQFVQSAGSTFYGDLIGTNDSSVVLYNTTTASKQFVGMSAVGYDGVNVSFNIPVVVLSSSLYRFAGLTVADDENVTDATIYNPLGRIINNNGDVATMWDSENDGLGSTLDADLVRGKAPVRIVVVPESLGSSEDINGNPYYVGDFATTNYGGTYYGMIYMKEDDNNNTWGHWEINTAEDFPWTAP